VSTENSIAAALFVVWMSGMAAFLAYGQKPRWMFLGTAAICAAFALPLLVQLWLALVLG
jgi:hypothetical protein